jgi:putative exosortase-associated protein (TIGR04073 family)
MRRRSGGTWLALASLLALGPAARVHAAQPEVPKAVWKLGRGVANVAFGLPSEVARHTITTSTDDGDTVAETASRLGTGMLLGVAWGMARVASGLLDVATFPVPFADNRPLLEPEFAL